jgi:uncharacterized protein
VRAGFLLDANVLISLAWSAHRSHGKVLEWFKRRASAGWATCPLTEASFVRILSNPAFSPDALTPRDALALLQANVADPGHRFWADEVGLAHALEPFQTRITGHQRVTDAYLLGLAMHQAGKLATMDESIVTLLPEKKRQEFIELI